MTLAVVHRKIQRAHQRNNFLINNSMDQSLSCGANTSSSRQEIPRTVWNPKVRYRIHKRPPLVLILRPINTVYASLSHLLKTHFNIILPYTPKCSQKPLPLRNYSDIVDLKKRVVIIWSPLGFWGHLYGCYSQVANLSELLNNRSLHLFRQ